MRFANLESLRDASGFDPDAAGGLDILAMQAQDFPRPNRVGGEQPPPTRLFPARATVLPRPCRAFPAKPSVTRKFHGHD